MRTKPCIHVPRLYPFAYNQRNPRLSVYLVKNYLDTGSIEQKPVDELIKTEGVCLQVVFLNLLYLLILR